MVAVTTTAADADYADALAEAEAIQPESVFANQRHLLGDLMRQGPPPVEFLPSGRLGPDLFYRGHVFSIAGHKKSGKSWCMALLAAAHIEAGRPVVYIDQENGWEVFAERLLLIDIDPDRADELLVYIPFPKVTPLLDHLRLELDAIGELYPGALVIFDSLRTFLARYGLSPNSDVEVEQFLGPIMGAVKEMPPERQITVGIIDHANRQTRDGDEYAAAGSQAKAAGVDVTYACRVIDKFSESGQGAIKLTPVDDRRGKLPEARYYSVGGQGDDAPLHFEHVDRDELPRETNDTEERVQRIAHAVHEHGGTLTRSDAIRVAGLDNNTSADRALKEAVRRDLLIRPARGSYAPGPNVPDLIFPDPNEIGADPSI